MLKMVDVSQYNVINNYELLARNVSAILIKCGQGVREDITFRNKYDNSLKVGLRTGIWFFYHPDMEAKPQIDKFISIYNLLDIKPRWIGLDVEESSYYETVDNKLVSHTVLPPSTVSYSAWIWQWLIEVERLTGVVPAVYTRATWWNIWVSGNVKWSKYPLWVANYGVSKPTLPKDWKTWQFWQRGTSIVPGILTAVDTDWFDGTEKELDAVFGLNTSSSSNTIPESVVNPTGTVTARIGLRVHTEPSIYSPKLRTLTYGSQIEIFETQGDWYRISKTQEWVSKTWVKVETK